MDRAEVLSSRGGLEHGMDTVLLFACCCDRAVLLFCAGSSSSREGKVEKAGRREMSLSTIEQR